MIHWEVEYYRDVWEDDHTLRRAVYDQEPGEIIFLGRLVEKFAYMTCSFAVVRLNGEIVANYTRDAESGEWREWK